MEAQQFQQQILETTEDDQCWSEHIVTSLWLREQ
jgi:hypothetical protein